MKIQHTVNHIVRTENSNVGTTAAKLFGDNAVRPGEDSVVTSITNNHATQDLLVKVKKVNDAAETDISTTYDELIPAKESRQFQFEIPHPLNPVESVVFWIQGSGATTTYSAKRYR